MCTHVCIYSSAAYLGQVNSNTIFPEVEKLCFSSLVIYVGDWLSHFHARIPGTSRLNDLHMLMLL